MKAVYTHAIISADRPRANAF